mgnify:CR=1 FL=1
MLPEQSPNRQTPKQRSGAIAEQSAKRFLIEQGLEFVEQNVRFKVGELDLIFLDESSYTYIFVEVRFRKNNHFGGAAASISRKKQQNIKKAAIFYLQKRKLTPNIRFDVIAYENGQLNWIESAFS